MSSWTTIAAILVVLLIVIVAVTADPSRQTSAHFYGGTPVNYGVTAADEARGPPTWSHFPEKPEFRSLFRDAADVDPMVTGQLYAWRDNTRDIYGARTSHGDKHGLAEYGSGLSGEVGVDVGPHGINEYSGEASPDWSYGIGPPSGNVLLPGFDDHYRGVPPDRALAASRYDTARAHDTYGYDDGIPENWRFPSTPVRWYRPKMRDHYGPEGPTVHKDHLYSLTEPDHDPLLGPDPDGGGYY